MYKRVENYCSTANLVLDDTTTASSEDPVYPISLCEHRAESQREAGR